jgi:hypothetical protein
VLLGEEIKNTTTSQTWIIIFKNNQHNLKGTRNKLCSQLLANSKTLILLLLKHHKSSPQRLTTKNSLNISGGKMLPLKSNSQSYWSLVATCQRQYSDANDNVYIISIDFCIDANNDHCRWWYLELTLLEIEHRTKMSPLIVEH